LQPIVTPLIDPVKFEAVNLYVLHQQLPMYLDTQLCGAISLPAESTAADANVNDPVNPVLVKSIVIKDGITDAVEKLNVLLDKVSSKFLVTETSLHQQNKDDVCKYWT